MAIDRTGLPGFERRLVGTMNRRVLVHYGGGGPAVLLLHGFPETSRMWRDIAPILAARHSIVAADLPGYGGSDCPPDGADHRPLSKRAMAETLVEMMAVLGHPRFAVVGHDRGGRVAYRMALDHPEAVARLVVLDVVPTAEVWARADARFALAFWPFSLLAQSPPLPERLILGAPEAVVEGALSGWDTPVECFPADVRQAYVEALRDPAHVHAICEEYRAAATGDREDDEADRSSGRRIACPVLALWSESGALAEWYAEAGGPLGLWRRWAEDVRGQAVPGGHFFPEEHPEDTAARLQAFLAETPVPGIRSPGSGLAVTPQGR